MFGQAQRAGNATDQNKLIRLSKSRDEKVRLMVARNQNTPPDVLYALARDEDKYVVEAIAQNPSSPMNLLRDMIFFDTARSRNGVWKNIANRKDLTPEVLNAFSQSPAHAAIDFISKHLDVVEKGNYDRFHKRRIQSNWLWTAELFSRGLYLEGRVNPLVIEAFLKIKDSRRYRFDELSFLSIYEVVASLHVRHLTERAMLMIVQKGDAEAQRILAINNGVWLSRDAAAALSTSQDWEVLNAISLHSELDDNARILISKKLATQPEWIEWSTQRAWLRELTETTPTQQKSGGQTSTGTSRPQRAFDSPVEEMFWDAYQKLKPKSLTGLVTQHSVGRYRLDFAIPSK